MVNSAYKNITHLSPRESLCAEKRGGGESSQGLSKESETLQRLRERIKGRPWTDLTTTKLTPQGRSPRLCSGLQQLPGDSEHFFKQCEETGVNSRAKPSPTYTIPALSFADKLPCKQQTFKYLHSQDRREGTQMIIKRQES